MTLFLGLENPLTSVKICLRSRWFIWSSVINANSTRRPLGVLHFARVAQAPERRNEKKRGEKYGETKNEAPALQLPWCVPDCAKWKNEYWKHFGTAATWKVWSGQGQGTYGSHGSHGSLQLCVSGTSIWNLRLEVLHCSVHGEFLASLETEHNSPNPVASNKTQEAQLQSQCISGFWLFSFLPWSLSRMMIVVWLLVIFGHAFRRSLWDSVNVFRRNSCHSSWATSHGFSL